MGVFLPDHREGGNFKAAIKQENKAAESVCQGGQPQQSQQGTLLRIRKHSSFFKQVAAFHTQSPNVISSRMRDTSPKGFSEAQCPAAAPGTPGQQGAAGDSSLARTSEAVGSYRRPWRVKPSSFSPEHCVLRGKGEWACTSSSSHCSKSTGQIQDVDCAGRPAALGACASSSFFVVSIGGQAGQSHFFLRVLQVTCKEQREVKADLNAKPFFMQNAT